MAAFDTTRPFATSGSAAGSITRLFTNAVGAFAAWNDARVTRKSLSSLTDRELEDIGLQRSDIEVVSIQR